MNDIFREVDEEYRQEQILQFWHTNSKLIIVVLILAIAGAAGTGVWQSRKLADRQTETYNLAHAEEDASTEKPADAYTTLDKIIAQMTGHRIIPARFAAARAAAEAGDAANAIKIYDAISGDRIATVAEQGLATILSVSLQLQDGDPAQLSAKLDKMAGDDNGFHFSARAMQALLAMRQGDKQTARDIAIKLAKDHDAPDGIHATAIHIAALAGEGLPLAPGLADPADNAAPLPDNPQ